ncbi:MAG: alpha-2-macroglobulin, partial [Lewinella sp.]|nr:alpha-2-macroglobulin [Lewinella sp.]
MRHTSLNILLLALFLISLTHSQRNRHAEPIPPDLQEYVYAFTQGVVSRTAPVRIQFTQAVADSTQIGQEAARGLASLSPGASGTWTWEDAQTLTFTPDPYLNFGTAYLVTVDLRELFANLPDNAHELTFDFHTRDPHASLDIGSLATPDLQERGKQTLSGTLFTSDYVENEVAEGMLAARQEGTRREISWSHNRAGTQHDFLIEEIARTDDASSVSLSWTGNAIGADQQGEEEVEIPAIGDFRLLSAEAVNGPEAAVLLHFSDPIKTQQNFSGLVTVTNTDNDFRYTVEGQDLRVHLGQSLSGNQTVQVSPGILNIYEDRLEKASRWELSFSTLEPEVRLVGRGVILPESNGLLFPFEAVGLSAVEVEIFKIFNNNILQFLQVNDLEGNYDLHRVGRIILRKEIQLNELAPGSSQDSWRRYALDLSQLIETDPQALYQVRIGFRPRHSLYPCGQADDYDFQTERYDGGQESIMYGWYGIEGYYNGYSWEQRDNPCFPAYYNSDRFVQRNVLASNLGIIAKGNDREEFTMIVTNLRTTEPISGATLTFYDFQQQVIGTAVTNGEGIVQAKFEEEPFVVVAEAGNERGYLRLQDGESLSLSRFDVSGVAAQEGLKGFLYGERGVWRPGDSVFLNFVLEDASSDLPAQYPVSFELRDARGQVRLKRDGVMPRGNIYPLYFATQPDDPTGVWRAQIKAGNANFYQSLRIETIKPNRLKVDLDFGSETLKAGTGTLRGQLASSWLHGAPASGLKAQVEVAYQRGSANFKGFEEFRFFDPRKSFSADNQVIFDGTLNDAGETTVELPEPRNQDAPGPLRTSFRTRVFEPGGDFSTDRFSLPFHPYDHYAGVRTPRNRYGYPRLDIGETETVQFATVNTDGQPASGRKITVELIRVEWRWWWDDSDNDGSHYNGREVQNMINRETLTTDNRGLASWNVKVDDWGRYLIRVCDNASGHCSGDFVYAGSPWYGDSQDGYPAEAAMLMFTSDKDKYEVGEAVEITFPTGQDGRALISLEGAEGVIRTDWIQAKAGDNTYSFTTTPEMTPTVYVHVTVLQPHGQTQNDLPIRLYGVIPVQVEDPDTRLQPVIAMPDELQPEQSVTIEVSETNGQPMSYTLAIVDEGLLSLTRFKTPNPWDVFYAREALSVRTWDMYEQVLGAQGGQLDRIIGIGGDGEAPGKPDADRANRFEPVVMHLGPFQLDRRGKARHTIRLPNYIGAVRTMVVAAGNKAYGAAEKTTPVRKPLMVLATLPRVLGPGETVDLPVSVFAMKDHVKNVTVRLEESSGLVNIPESRKQVRFSRVGDELITFPVQVSEATGVARFRVVAEGNGEQASQEIEIDIRNPNPMQSDVVRFVLNPGEEQTLDYVPLGTAGTRSTVLEMTNLPPLNLERRLQYLLRYPYGCLEQTLSAAFPQLYLARFYKLDERQQQRTRTNIRAALDKLRRFQLSSGGFGYWPNARDANQWATTYAGHFLLAAQAEGYTLPAGMLDRWERFQSRVAQRWDPEAPELGYAYRGNHQLQQAYRPYTLALA